MFGKKRRNKKKGSRSFDGPERIGRYTIQDILGQGGMGTVYLGRDPVIGRNIAIKVIRLKDDMSEDETAQYRERFLREAQAAGGLQHPNIVGVHDIGQDPIQGQPYIVMEHVPGRDLKQIIRAEAPLPAWSAIRFVVQIASALDYAHGRGIVHRDIKPANVLISEDGQLKITDFGVARLPDSDLTQTDQFVGSPGFVSPEQLRGAVVDGRSDLFSLGVILYQLLTGHSPFEGESTSEVLYRISNQPAKQITEMLPSLPAEFNAILDKALSKDPEGRYQSGRELMEALIALEMSGVIQSPRKETDREIDETTGTFTPIVSPPTRTPSPWFALNSQWRLATLLGALVLTFVLINVGINVLLHGPLGRMAARANAAERNGTASASTGPLGLIGGVLPVGSGGAAETPMGSIGAMSDPEGDSLLDPLPVSAQPASDGTAKIKIEFDHRLESGRLIIVVGGKTALSRPFDAAPGEASGSFSHLLSIPAGPQGIEVKILGEMGEIRARSKIDGTIDPDEVAVLKIEQRNRKLRPMTLEWTSP